MPLKDGRIYVEVPCSCGSTVGVTSGTFGSYCPTCGRSVFTSNYKDQLNEEIRYVVHTEKLKIRKERGEKGKKEDFSVGSSVFLSSCASCGGTLSADNVFIVDGETVCKNCYENEIPKCKGCGQRHFKQNLKKGLCQGCAESYMTCPTCGEVYDKRKKKCFEVEGKTLCDNCCPTYLNQKGIHFDGYSRKPTPTYYGEKEVGYYFGVELEMDNSQRRNEFMARSFTDEVYYKSDGSLGPGGCELVTYPATLAYHMNELPWKKILSEAKKCGYKSHMGSSGSSGSPTCGLHIHVSKSAFGRNSDDIDKREAKLLLLFDKFWDQLVIFSRRDRASLERWAKRYASFDITKDQLNDIVHKAKSANSGDRRHAVNFTGNGGATIEFRLFRGTLNYNTLIASIQLIDMFIEASKLTTKKVQSLTWTEFAEEGMAKYVEFNEYITRLRSAEKNQGKI